MDRNEAQFMRPLLQARTHTDDPVCTGNGDSLGHMVTAALTPLYGFRL